MYDSLSSDYDRFINWPNRLRVELPFIITELEAIQAHSVLDAATGTGMHAIALAQQGYSVAGADLSSGMVERARLNATSATVQARFEIAAFGALSQAFGKQSFDAVLCLGNSLPHLITLPELEDALADFAASLRAGGMLLIQNRNFDAIMAQHERWMEPQAYSDGKSDWLFQRFYDFDTDGLVTFNMVTFKRIGQGNWSQQVVSSRLRPLLKEELIASLRQAGFSDIETFGNMSGAQYDLMTSPNLVVVARIT
jgi:glycine/sarcosine N-methyltransferase